MTRYVLLKTSAAETESVSAHIWEIPGVLGIEELPGDGQLVFRPDVAHHFVRFDARQAYEDWLRTEEYRRGDPVLLKVYFVDTAVLAALQQSSFRLAIIAEGIVEERDYLADMRAQHHGRVIADFWVGPPWETPAPGKLPILIEPGTAFGLGDHPTTQLCLELLVGAGPQREPLRILDFGAGSGILAIAAAKLLPGCALTLVEIDRQCWPNIKHNFALNSLPRPVIHETSPAGPFDLVLANIYLEILKTAVVNVDARRLILSGLLGAEQLADFNPAPYRVLRQLRREDWFALELGRC